MDKQKYIANNAVLNVLSNSLKNVTKISSILNGDSYEIKTNYNKSESEVIIQGRSNSLIVLGRDRDSGLASGNGGIGYSGASAIDIIAGHGGPLPLDTLFGEKVLSEKNFKLDSSRIYLTQKAKNIDEYFEIKEIKLRLGNKSNELEKNLNKSAVALKADLARIIARENVKIVTIHNGLNSNNKRGFPGGVDIIAGCNAVNTDKTLSVQPMVKGSNLEVLIKQIIKKIEDVQSTVSTFMKTQKEINDILSNHVHQSGAPGHLTDRPLGSSIGMKNFTILTKTLPDILKNNISISTIEGDYLSPFNQKYILSLWNRVN